MPLGVRLKEQRGSVLIVAMVLILAMTILGLALFDLAQIEGQMAGTSQTDARALYIAQAGLERGIRELRDGWMADSNAAGGYGTETWADATNGPTCTPTACDASVYTLMNIANTSLPATGTDPGGAYTLEMKLVLVAEANNPISQGGAYTYPYGQECIPDTGSPTICANLVFLRSTGTVNGPPGFTSTVSVQTMAKAWPTSPFAAALTGGGQVHQPNPGIDGEFLAAGTVQILGFQSSNPAIRFQGGSSDGLRNNYWTLDGTYELDRIRRRQLVCPPQTNCSGGANLVESLGAEIRIYGGDNTTTMVRLDNNTNAGLSANTASYGQATGGNTRVGKGRLDGVYIATGCLLPCTSGNIPFNFGSGAQIWVDYNNFTKPYQDRPPKLPLLYQAGFVYPVLNQPARINGTNYPSYSTDFMLTHQVPSLNTQQVNGGVCPNNNLANGWECSAGLPLAVAPTLGTLFDPNSGPPWNGSFNSTTIGPFRHSFTFTDKSGTGRNAEICWKRSAMTNPGNRDAGVNGPNLPNQAQAAERPLTLEFGIPDCTAPNPPTNPILINFGTAFAISRHGFVTNKYTYRGSAIFLMQSSVQLEETLLSYCTRDTASPGTAGECPAGPAGERFAEDHLLVFLSPTTVSIGVANTNVNTVMAHVWSNYRIVLQRDTKVIGSLRADYICFRNSSSSAACSVGGGGTEPSVYQVTPWDLRKIPEELPGGGASGDRWRIDTVPRFYLVCRPGGTLPTTPTGACGYQ